MPNPLEMSDEDFLKQGYPPVAGSEEPASGASGEVAAPATEQAEETQPEQTETEQNQEEQDNQPEADPASTPDSEADPSGSAAPPSGQEVQEQGKPEGAQTTTQPKEGTPAAGASETQQETPPDYEALYKRIMAPFKANGRMIEPRTPEELIQLAQMGANYTWKMQDLQPHRKMLIALENNGLLSDEKINWLIDLGNKNPEAIKKLVKDAGIDPLEIDTNADSAYRASNHQVSDEEANFRSVLDDVQRLPTGQSTLQAINGWDQASKDVLWKSPEIMTIIHSQRENGIYDRITAELDRQKTLGQIAPTIPFLQAYKAVGDQLMAANAFADLGAPAPSTPATPVQAAPVVPPAPVATNRPVAPKPTAIPNEKVQAAAPTRSLPGKGRVFTNPLAMSDEDFLKSMPPR